MITRVKQPIGGFHFQSKHKIGMKWTNGTTNVGLEEDGKFGSSEPQLIAFIFLPSMSELSISISYHIL